MQVMLVEKHGPLARLYREELEEAGFRVRVCSDIRRALLSLQQDPVQFVILDASLPESCLQRWLPSLRQVHPGPVVALGGHKTQGLSRSGVLMVPKSSDLRPLIGSLQGQAAALLWNKTARA